VSSFVHHYGLAALFLIRIADSVRTRRRKRARELVAARSVDVGTPG